MDRNPEITTGQERDSESNLDHFPARYYSSQMGRFMTPDPLGIFSADLTDPQTLNQYSYVRNNPVSLFDPTGLAPQCTLVTSWASSMIYQGSPDHGPGEPINIVGAPSTTLVCADTGNDSPITLGGGGYRPPSIGSRLTNTRISDTPINLLPPTKAQSPQHSYSQCISNFNKSTAGKAASLFSLLNFFNNLGEWVGLGGAKTVGVALLDKAEQSEAAINYSITVGTTTEPAILGGSTILGTAGLVGIGAGTTVDAAARLGCSENNPNDLFKVASPILPIFPQRKLPNADNESGVFGGYIAWMDRYSARAGGVVSFPGGRPPGRGARIRND